MSADAREALVGVENRDRAQRAKTARLDLRKQMLAMIVKMQPGAGLKIQLPEAAFPRRERYRIIAGLAHTTWGPGTYKVQIAPDSMLLIRVKTTALRAGGQP